MAAGAGLNSSGSLLQRPHSAGSLGSLRRSRPGSAASARKVVPVPEAPRSAAIWTDPKMQTLQGFIQKMEGNSVADQDDAASGKDEGDGSDDEGLDPEAEVPIAATSSLAERHSTTLDTSQRLSAASLNGGLNESANLGATATSLKSAMTQGTSPSQKKKLRRPASAGTLQGRRQRPNMLPQRQRSQGCERLDRKVRELAKASKGGPAAPRTGGSAAPRAGVVARYMESTKARMASAPKVREEMDTAEDRRQKLDSFQTGVARQQLDEQAERLLRRLFVDVTLARDSGGPPKYSHKSRCDHLDKVYAWYEHHALVGKAADTAEKAGPQVGNALPWLFVNDDEPPPPGSMRNPRIRQSNPSLSHAQPGSAQRHVERSSSISRSASTSALGAAL